MDDVDANGRIDKKNKYWTALRFCFTLSAIIVWVVLGSFMFTLFEGDRQAAGLRDYTEALQTFQLQHNISNDALSELLDIVGASELDQLDDLTTAQYTEPYGYYFPDLYTMSSTFAIITTVGYGKIAPETPAGRLWLCISIIVGLPVMGGLLAWFSKVLLGFIDEVRCTTAFARFAAHCSV
jgi:potassium channel subfamily K protein 5